MSEQEKKSGVSGASPVVLVEQTTGSRHKPYRPTELQDDGADLHHKRSRAPAVPSVTEELKNSEDSNPSEYVESKDRKDSERTTSEKYKHNVAKKISSSIKKRGSSPESIALAPIDTETKTGIISTTPGQPIPPDVESLASEKDAQKKAEEDSITEEIAELRTPDAKRPEWDACRTRHLERKASVGPYTFGRTPYQGPSGICICVPRNSSSIVIDDLTRLKSGINICVAKKNTTNKSKLCNRDREKNKPQAQKQAVKVDIDIPSGKIFGVIKEKFGILRKTIRNVANNI